MSSFRTVTVLAFAASLTIASNASATGVDEASPKYKGIVGGALLGAEAVMLTEAAIGVKPRWAYYVGGAAGAVAGGVGGYFMEENLSAKTNMFLLSAGMVLAIPTVIAVAAATQYEPPASYVQDQAPTDEPVANPPAPEGAAVDGVRKVTRRARLSPTLASPTLPPALVGVERGELALSVPSIALCETFTRKQMAEFGVKQQTELRLPVFNLVF